MRESLLVLFSAALLGWSPLSHGDDPLKDETSPVATAAQKGARVDKLIEKKMCVTAFAALIAEKPEEAVKVNSCSDARLMPGQRRMRMRWFEPPCPRPGGGNCCKDDGSRCCVGKFCCDWEPGKPPDCRPRL